MAKKKTEASEKTEKKSAGGAKSKSTKKPAAKSKAAGAGGGGAFGIDTNLAAAAAARMLTARNQLKAQSGAGEKDEGSLVKQIKQDLSKPAAGSMANLLDKTGGPGAKRPNLPFGGGNQVGHNQTTGGNVNRAVIPRRTGG
jgi:hypothetical protein